MKIQVAVITLSDGRKVYFSGPAAIDPEKDTKLRITDIAFSEPQDAADDVSFCTILSLLKNKQLTENKS